MPPEPPRPRYVWILRHARAEAQGGRPDRDRALTPAGRADAEFLGKRLGPGGDLLGLDPGTLPTLVVSSPARRARQTAELATAEMSPAPRLVVVPGLYGAAPPAMRALVDEEAGGADACMVVGHNPTLAVLVAESLRGDDRAGAARLDQAGFRPATLAVLAVPGVLEGPRGPRPMLAPGTAVLVGIFHPPYGT